MAGKLKKIILFLLIMAFAFMGVWILTIVKYDQELHEDPFYIQIEDKWYQYNTLGSTSEVKFPEGFQALSCLEKDHATTWLGIMDKAGEKSLVVIDLDTGFLQNLCSEKQLKKEGICVDLIKQWQWRPKAQDLSFMYGNLLYLLDCKNQDVILLCADIKQLDNGFHGNSYLWMDEESILYVDQSTEKICRYNISTLEKQDLNIPAFRLLEWDEKTGNLFYVYANRQEFLFYNTYGCLCKYSIESQKREEIYTIYSGDIIGVNADLKGVVLEIPQKEDLYYSDIYYTKFNLIHPRIRVVKGQNRETLQIVWP